MPVHIATTVRDVLLGDLGHVVALLLLPGAAQLVERGLGDGLGVAQRGGALVVLVVDRRVLLLGDAVELLLGRLQVGRQGRRAQADAAGRLVDEVDGLVGQVAVGDVADRQVRGGVDGGVRDPDLVMLLVALADALQDVDRLLQGRLFDHDLLEAPLEGRVALDVLPEFVQGGGADALELAAGEGRLEDVGRVDGALRGTRPDQRVELIDEEDGVVGAAQLLDDLLEPLLELAAVLGPGDQRADVEGQHALVEEGLRNVTGDDALGQTFGDGGLADARLADEGGVVLRPAREDLDDPLDLLLAADDGVDLAGPDGIGQVDAELVDGRRLAGPLGLGGRSGAARLGQDADDLVADLVEIDAQRLEDAGGDALAFAHEAQEQVLGADVVVAQPPGLVDGQLDDPLGARRQADLADDRTIAAADDELDGGADLGQLDVHVLEHPRGDALALAHEPEQEVLRPDVVVVEPLRLVLSERQDLARAIGELVETVHSRSNACSTSNGEIRRLAGYPSTGVLRDRRPGVPVRRAPEYP